MFIHESILKSIAKFITEEAVHRGDIEFSLSLDELESFVALQYARGLYEKNHPVVFCGTRGTESPFSLKQCHGTNLQKY